MMCSFYLCFKISPYPTPLPAVPADTWKFIGADCADGAVAAGKLGIAGVAA
jgi:hypothetical protein